MAQSDDGYQKGGNNILGNCNGRDISVMINSGTSELRELRTRFLKI